MEEIEKIRSKFIGGKASVDELKLLDEWLARHPEERKALFYDKDILDAYTFISDSKNYSPEQEFMRFRSRLKHARPSESVRLPSFLRIAAVIVLAFILGGVVHSLFFGAHFQQHPMPDESRVISVPKGQVSQLFLADGTRIWINSESTVQAPSVFKGENRTVKLSGEAYFEVAEDPDHPFHVEVDGQLIEVLGTSFNVRAYPDSREVQTTLSKGSVKLQTSKGYMMLEPGQQAELDRLTGEITLNKVNTANYEAWKEGRYEFVNENLIEVFHMVERWYDVELIYDESEFRNMNFSGVIRRNKPAEHFMILLGHSIPITYEMIGQDKIKIRSRQ